MTQNTTLPNLNVDPTDATDLAGIDRTAMARLDWDRITVRDLADWLAAHGASHLGAIERIELAERLITRRRFIIGAGGLIGATALGACGADEEAATSTATVNADYPREVRDTTDAPVRIPTRPQRIVCLSNLGDLDTLLSLGVVPIQFGIRSFIAEWTGSPERSWSWHEDALAELEGTPERTNADSPADPEGVLLARPDLIIGLEFWIGEAREELAEIAPVLQLGRDWRQNLRIVGEALVLEELAEQRISETEQKIASALGEVDIGEATVAFADPRAEFVFTPAHPAFPIVDLFQQAGFSLVDTLAAESTPDIPLQLSLELVPEHFESADLLVITAYDLESTTVFLEDPIVQTIPAVRNERVLIIEQGPIAQSLAFFSPLNVDLILPVLGKAADLVD